MRSGWNRVLVDIDDVKGLAAAVRGKRHLSFLLSVILKLSIRRLPFSRQVDDRPQHNDAIKPSQISDVCTRRALIGQRGKKGIGYQRPILRPNR